MKSINAMLSRVGLVAMTGLMAVPAFAAEGDPDFTIITAGVVVTGIATGLIAMGLVKLGPNVASWGSKKLSGFFR